MHPASFKQSARRLVSSAVLRRGYESLKKAGLFSNPKTRAGCAAVVSAALNAGLSADTRSFPNARDKQKLLQKVDNHFNKPFSKMFGKHTRGNLCEEFRAYKELTCYESIDTSVSVMPPGFSYGTFAYGKAHVHIQSQANEILEMNASTLYQINPKNFAIQKIVDRANFRYSGDASATTIFSEKTPMLSFTLTLPGRIFSEQTPMLSLTRTLLSRYKIDYSDVSECQSYASADFDYFYEMSFVNGYCTIHPQKPDKNSYIFISINADSPAP